MARPKSFDPDEVVEAALQVFLAKGYDGASISELTAAMGINPPSLYATFGDKRGLFDRVVARYAGRRSPLLEAALAAPSAREAVSRLMHSYADGLTDPSWPPGCLYVQAALSCSNSAQPVRDELVVRRLAIEPELQERFERAHREGDLAMSVDAADLARYCATLLQGMAIQAASGTSREALHALADLVVRQLDAMIDPDARIGAIAK
jgi:AcrR family transcriptional regulator